MNQNFQQPMPYQKPTMPSVSQAVLKPTVLSKPVKIHPVASHGSVNTQLRLGMPRMNPRGY